MKLPKVLILILIAFILFTTISYSSGQAEGNIQQQRYIILTISRVGYDQLTEMPNIKALMDNSYIGLMNTRASGRYNELKSYASIGWGTRAEASEATDDFHKLDDEAREIYQRRVGQVLPKGGLINLSINNLQQLNLSGEFKAMPGTMGEQLRKAGYKTAAIGNSDTDNNASRAIGFIAMDAMGYIDYGNLSRELTLEDISSPFGLRTNYDKLMSEFEAVYGKAHLVAIETGDLSRLEAYRSNLNSSAYSSHRRTILNNIDNFVGELVGKINFKDTKLIILTPYPTDAAYEAGDRLTPIIIYDGDEGTRGLLTSDTTRREGIIGNVDIAPTVLAAFNLQPENITGKKITTIDREGHLSYIMELNSRTVNTSVNRYRILYTFAVFEMLASVLALLAIVYKKRMPKGLTKLSAILLLSTAVIPLVFLILPIVGSTSMFTTYVAIVLISAVLTLILYYVSKGSPLNTLMLICLLVTTGLLLDIVTGQNLIKGSILGYDPIIGARYYGIGNEFAGVLIGSTLVGAAAFREKYRVRPEWIMLFFTMVIFFIGYPRLGANVGATITALFAFLFAYFLMTAKRMSIKRWGIIVAIIFAAISTFAFIDYFLMESKSHLAGAIQQIANGGPLVVYQIILRKITMNLRVMGVTIWSRVLLLALGILGILFYRPIGLLKSLATKYPSLLSGWSGIIAACIVGFMVNDSGVVMAATCIIYLTTSILYLLLAETEKGIKK